VLNSKEKILFLRKNIRTEGNMAKMAKPIITDIQLLRNGMIMAAALWTYLGVGRFGD